MRNGLNKRDYASVLLELSAANDLIGFRRAWEEKGYDVDEASMWYGRSLGSKKMGYEERTPLMIAAMFGSVDVVIYVLKSGLININRASGSDGATALHCAVVGGSAASSHVVRLLLDASADINAADANGKLPIDLVYSYKSVYDLMKKSLAAMLKGHFDEGTAGLYDRVINDMGEEIVTTSVSKDGNEKKEYPVDLSLPDINNGIYSTDEFRMFTFKVRPCSRAYSHDWTECPFVHPGENARRRDPRKYHYSCVPCPEFRKGCCRLGDACEYAHGIFECWLHPAQYRTRLCKDEVGCGRKVCFFAHKPEELRPLYASTGSAVPSPRSLSAAESKDLALTSLLALGSIPTSPSRASSAMWKILPGHIPPPILQLPTGRVNAAQIDELRRQQIMDEISSLSSPSSWGNGSASALPSVMSSGSKFLEMNRLGGVKPNDLEDLFGQLNSGMSPQFRGGSMDSVASQLQSLGGIELRQSLENHLQSSYPNSIASSPSPSPKNGSNSFGFNTSIASSEGAVLSLRSASFATRSQSFVERSSLNQNSGVSSPPGLSTNLSSRLSAWGSPDGKLEWGIQREELRLLRKSASFGLRSSTTTQSAYDEPVMSSLVKDTLPVIAGQLGFEDRQKQFCHLDNSGSETLIPPSVEQFYAEQEQLVA